MHYIIQSNLHQDEAMIRLKEVLTQFDLPFSEHKVIPFIGELEPEPKLDRNDVICFGSYSMRHYAKKMGWTPGVYDCEPYDHKMLNLVFGNKMLNYDSTFTTFKNSRVYVRMCIDQFGAVFIRPIHDTKVFAGVVYTDFEEFERWWKGVCILEEDDGTSLRKETQVMVAIPQKIASEYRFFVVDGNIVTGSQYKIGNRIQYKEVDKNDTPFIIAKETLKDALFNINLRSYVIDFALMYNDNSSINSKYDYKIVEVNTMNSAGMYACDVQKIIMALEG